MGLAGWSGRDMGGLVNTCLAITCTELGEADTRPSASESIPACPRRLNLTLRAGSAYLHRRSPCHARKERCLEEHLELLRCHYNFIRPHRALRFGKVTRTPAMQAGLAERRYSFRDIFGLVVPESRGSGTVVAWETGIRPSCWLSRAA